MSLPDGPHPKKKRNGAILVGRVTLLSLNENGIQSHASQSSKEDASRVTPNIVRCNFREERFVCKLSLNMRLSFARTDPRHSRHVEA